MKIFIDVSNSKASEIKSNLKEDEVVEINGKKWTRKNGIITNIPKIEIYKVPLFCPKCGKLMNNEDSKIFRTGKESCADCYYKEITKMQIDGTYDIKNKKYKLDYKMGLLKDRLDALKDATKEENRFKQEVTSGNGDIMEIDNSAAIEKAKVEIKKIESEIIELEKEYKNVGFY